MLSRVLHRETKEKQTPGIPEADGLNRRTEAADLFAASRALRSEVADVWVESEDGTVETASGRALRLTTQQLSAKRDRNALDRGVRRSAS